MVWSWGKVKEVVDFRSNLWLWTFQRYPESDILAVVDFLSSVPHIDFKELLRSSATSNLSCKFSVKNDSINMEVKVLLFSMEFEFWRQYWICIYFSQFFPAIGKWFSHMSVIRLQFGSLLKLTHTHTKSFCFLLHLNTVTHRSKNWKQTLDIIS